MTKYYEIHTKIPDIGRCPQVWYVKDDDYHRFTDLIDFDNGFMAVKNIVGANNQQLSCTKTLWCREEYFICAFESQYKGEKYEH